MHQVGLAVAVDPDFAAALFEPGRHVLEQLQAQQRFAVAAEDHFVITARIADRLFDFFGAWFVLEEQFMAFDNEILEFGAEDTVIGAAVGDIQIQRVADLIGDLGTLIDLTETEQVEAVATGHPGDIFDR